MKCCCEARCGHLRNSFTFSAKLAQALLISLISTPFSCSWPNPENILDNYLPPASRPPLISLNVPLISPPKRFSKPAISFHHTLVSVSDTVISPMEYSKSLVTGHLLLPTSGPSVIVSVIFLKCPVEQVIILPNLLVVTGWYNFKNTFKMSLT